MSEWQRQKGGLQSHKQTVGDEGFPRYLGLLMMTAMKRHKVPKMLFWKIIHHGQLFYKTKGDPGLEYSTNQPYLVSGLYLGSR